jgi:hypothetical protein
MGVKAKMARRDAGSATTRKMLVTSAAVTAGLVGLAAVAVVAGPSIWREIRMIRM